MATAEERLATVETEIGGIQARGCAYAAEVEKRIESLGECMRKKFDTVYQKIDGLRADITNGKVNYAGVAASTQVARRYNILIVTVVVTAVLSLFGIVFAALK